MTCICNNPKPAVMRCRDRKYAIICMNCTRTGYKDRRLAAAQFYWELATEPEKWADKEQPYPAPAGITDHPFLYESFYDEAYREMEGDE